MAYLTTGSPAFPAVRTTGFFSALRNSMRLRGQRGRIATNVAHLDAHLMKDVGLTEADLHGFDSHARFRDRLTPFY